MWPNPRFPVDLVIFTEEIVNGKLQSCAVRHSLLLKKWYIRDIWQASKYASNDKKSKKKKKKKIKGLQHKLIFRLDFFIFYICTVLTFRCGRLEVNYSKHLPIQNQQ